MPSSCPSCGTPTLAGMIFCDECGFDLRTGLSVPAAQPRTPPLDDNALPVYQPPIPSSQPVRARLYIKEANTSLDLPQDKPEIIIGREDAISGVFPDIDLEPFAAQDAGVSRRHVKLFLQGNTCTVEDLNTVNGTFLNRQKLSANQPAPLKHGDELRLGKLALIFYMD